MTIGFAWLLRLALKLAGEAWPYSPRTTARMPESMAVAVVLPIHAETIFTPGACGIGSEFPQFLPEAHI